MRGYLDSLPGRRLKLVRMSSLVNHVYQRLRCQKRIYRETYVKVLLDDLGIPFVTDHVIEITGSVWRRGAISVHLIVKQLKEVDFHRSPSSPRTEVEEGCATDPFA